MRLPVYKSTNDRKKPLKLTGQINETETFTKQATDANIKKNIL